MANWIPIGKSLEVFAEADGRGERIDVTYEGVIVGSLWAAEDEEGNIQILSEIADGISKMQTGTINKEDWK